MNIVLCFNQQQTFPCSFNSYDKNEDGKIAKAEFSEYTRKHGYDVEQSQFVFNTLDSNSMYFVSIEKCKAYYFPI